MNLQAGASNTRRVVMVCSASTQWRRLGHMSTAKIDMVPALRLAAEALCDARTARAWLAGREPRSYALRAALPAAAQRLGIVRAPHGG